MQRERVPSGVRDFLRSAKAFAAALDTLIEEQLPEIAGHPLPRSQLNLMRLVAASENYTLGEVAEFLGVSSAATSRTVDKLVQQGLLQRVPVLEDRRAIHLSLTDEGGRLLDRFEAVTCRALEQVFGQLRADDLHRTAACLDRLCTGLLQTLERSDEICLRCGVSDREECLLQERIGQACPYHRNHPEGELHDVPVGRSSSRGQP